VYASSRRTGDVKIVGRVVPYAKVAEPNTIWIHADQAKLKKFPPVCVQFG
jgi:hypothetical protein